jgi:ABC-type phosphate/phosphonate transport system permease subunit
MDFYKKLFLGTLTIVVAIILIIKFSLSSIENRIMEITKSEKFYNFISQRFKYEMNRHSSKELTQEEIDFYTIELNKILSKWKPVIDRLNVENIK